MITHAALVGSRVSRNLCPYDCLTRSFSAHSVLDESLFSCFSRELAIITWVPNIEFRRLDFDQCNCLTPV